MSYRVEVLDEIAGGLSAGAIAVVVEAVLAAELAKSGLVSVAFVDETVMAGLNRRYRGEVGGTDVLSFPESEDGDSWPTPTAPIPDPYAAEPEDEGPAEEAYDGVDLGEIVICPAVVSRYAREDNVPYEYQLLWTVIHGTLHLLGYDHERDQGEMRDRERALLNRLGPTLLDSPPPDAAG
jgi:probable rRNA maturation factor